MRYQGEGREGEHQMSALGRREEEEAQEEGNAAAAALLSLVGAGRSTRVSEIGPPCLVATAAGANPSITLCGKLTRF